MGLSRAGKDGVGMGKLLAMPRFGAGGSFSPKIQITRGRVAAGARRIATPRRGMATHVGFRSNPAGIVLPPHLHSAGLPILWRSVPQFGPPMPTPQRTTPGTNPTEPVVVSADGGVADAIGLKDRYLAVKDRIARAAKKAGTHPSSIMLVAVTKFAEPDQIRDLIRLGHSDFGENKIQQLVQRAAIIDEWMTRQKTMHGGAQASGQASTTPVRWHMIGHLQRNKARKAVELCRLIHSVDSLRLAEELQQIAHRREKPIEVLVQVNCSGENSKFGCAIGAAVHLADQIETMVQVKVRGLMTMAPYSSNPEDSRSTFGRCRELYEDIVQSGAVSPQFNILSMGMSGDFEVAIQEGANLVRVGTALFGEPKPGMEVSDDDDREEPEA